MIFSLALSLLFLLALYVWSALLWTIWLDHAEDVQGRRKELDRVMALTHDLNKRGPTGWEGKNEIRLTRYAHPRVISTADPRVEDRGGL